VRCCLGLASETRRDILLTRGCDPAIPAFWARLAAFEACRPSRGGRTRTTFATALLILLLSLIPDIAMGGGVDWIPVCSSSELPEGKSKVSSSGVAVFRKNGMLYAIEDRCSHGRWDPRRALHPQPPSPNFLTAGVDILWATSRTSTHGRPTDHPIPQPSTLNPQPSTLTFSSQR